MSITYKMRWPFSIISHPAVSLQRFLSHPSLELAAGVPCSAAGPVGWKMASWPSASPLISGRLPLLILPTRASAHNSRQSSPRSLIKYRELRCCERISLSYAVLLRYIPPHQGNLRAPLVASGAEREEKGARMHRISPLPSLWSSFPAVRAEGRLLDSAPGLGMRRPGR